MMLSATNVKDYLKTQFPTVKFYAGSINKMDTQCVGVYPRGRSPLRLAMGGHQNTSYMELPLTLLVHWTEDTAQCEQQAILLYEHLLKFEGDVVAGFNVRHMELLDSCPVDLSRTDKNICEMVIRVNVMYDHKIS